MNKIVRVIVLAVVLCISAFGADTVSPPEKSVENPVMRYILKTFEPGIYVECDSAVLKKVFIGYFCDGVDAMFIFRKNGTLDIEYKPEIEEREKPEIIRGRWSIKGKKLYLFLKGKKYEYLVEGYKLREKRPGIWDFTVYFNAQLEYGGAQMDKVFFEKDIK